MTCLLTLFIKTITVIKADATLLVQGCKPLKLEVSRIMAYRGNFLYEFLE